MGFLKTVCWTCWISEVRKNYHQYICIKLCHTQESKPGPGILKKEGGTTQAETGSVAPTEVYGAKQKGVFWDAIGGGGGKRTGGGGETCPHARHWSYKWPVKLLLHWFLMRVPICFNTALGNTISISPPGTDPIATARSPKYVSAYSTKKSIAHTSLTILQYAGSYSCPLWWPFLQWLAVRKQKKLLVFEICHNSKHSTAFSFK